MMQISGFSPRSSRPGTTSGFSLLEILIVLVLVSIMVALVSPRLADTVRAVQGSGERAEVVRQLQTLPLLARNGGEAITIARGDFLAAAGPLQMPEGWMVQAMEPVVVAANGVCSRSRIRVEHDGVIEEWLLLPPDCKVDSDDG